MGRRSRKRPIGEAAPASAAAERPSRSAERDAVARAQLTPLEPGERPAPLVVAAVISTLLAVANVAFYAAGVEVEGQEPALSGVLAFAGIMLVAAWGLLTQRYWAVLGFQALLAITIVVAALSLLVASNIAAVVLCLVIIGTGGWLFWKLVRVLGRMKVPRLGDA
ncbi:MAG TPA: hypothetical protein PKD63_06600 [Solirubrobacteraceae bacterium]|nr:hypothetical protein [Solirubrobacteraceae bacterium]